MTAANEASPLIARQEDNGSTSSYYDDLEGSLRGRVIQFGASVRKIGQMVKKHTGSIGMLGSISIAVNSLTGPAMLNLPALFAQSGIIPTLATLCLVCFISSQCCLHMSNSISKVPDNRNFRKEIEFSEVFRIFWGEQWYYVSHALFLMCILCLNISSIVDTAQVVDTFAGHWGPGGAIALQLGGTHCSATPIAGWQHLLSWDYTLCSQDDLVNGLCVPFLNCDGILITSGNIITTIVFLPLALLDLKENSWWQVVGFIVLIVTSFQFVVQFIQFGLSPSFLTWFGTRWDDLFGVVLFNFALVIAIPAWLYEKEPHVDVPRVIKDSSLLAIVLYVAIGLLGAMSMPNVSENMLESMMSGAFGTTMQLGASLFAFAIIGLGIPLFSVLTRLNLTGSGLCTVGQANLLSVYLPFGVSLCLSSGAAVSALLGWGGIFFTSLVAFVLPLMLSLHIVEQYDYQGFVAVGNFWSRLQPERVSEKLSLRILLYAAILSITIAIIGQFF